MSNTLRGKLLLAATSTLITLAIAFGLAEVAVRYRERHRSTVPGTMPLMYYPQKKTGVSLVRNSDNFGWVHVNAAGFRGADFSAAKPEGVIRIVAMGGSTTFDSQVSSDAKTWPTRLEYWIGQLAPGAKVQVLNAGVPGFHLYEDMYRLDADVAPLHPDIIIELQGHNDLFAILGRAADPQPPSNTPEQLDTFTPWGLWLNRHSLFYSKLTERLNLQKFARRGTKANTRRAGEGDNGADAAAYSQRVNDGFARFERDLAGYTEMAKLTAPLVVLVQPVHVSGTNTKVTDAQEISAWRSAMPFNPADTTLVGYRRIAQVLRDVAQRENVMFVPTDSFQIVGAKFYAEGDPIHFSDAGADLLAHKLAEVLVASHALERASKGGDIIAAAAPVVSPAGAVRR